MNIWGTFSSERAWQRAFVEELRRLGFTVRVTSAPSRGKRQMRSIADVLVRHPSWKRGRWQALEAKSLTGGFSNDDQEKAYLNGEFEIVRVWAEVADVLEIEYEEQTSF